MAKRRNPKRGLKFEEEELGESLGYSLIAGIDEVGRGCLAGPVVASAVIISREKHCPWFRRIRDSKLLTPDQREHLFPLIHEAAVSIGTGAIDSFLIDRLGMTRAVQLAMKIALEKLHPRPDYALIDYFTVPDLGLPQKGVEDGDTLCFSIACASVVAKVYRDHLMIEMDRRYPGYGFARHKGYSTGEHVDCLRRLGPSPIHRHLFGPVRNLAQLSFDDIQRITASLDDRTT